MSRRQVKVRISAELIFTALAFPEETQLIACDDSFLSKYGTIDLYVTHPGLPILAEDQEPILINPTFSQIGPSPSEYFKFDWNIENA